MKLRFITKKMQSIQRYTFPKNPFNSPWSSQRPLASVGVNLSERLYELIFKTFFGIGWNRGDIFCDFYNNNMYLRKYRLQRCASRNHRCESFTQQKIYTSCQGKALNLWTWLIDPFLNFEFFRVVIYQGVLQATREKAPTQKRYRYKRFGRI